MKTALLVLCLASVVSSQMIAQAIIKGTALDPNITGKVVFSQLPGQNVTVTVTISGITKSANASHGLHVHFWGDLSDGITSNSTGAHWATVNHTTHACPEGENSAIRHNGDMGNWVVSMGMINQTKTLDLLTLTGIDSIIGRAVVLHEAMDDCTTQPNGASSNRIAHGVIGVVNSTAYGGNAFANSGSNNTYAQVHLEKAAGDANVYGTVWFTQLANGVLVNAQIFGITGPHGFHLHWWGDISKQDGTATGVHFNPKNSMHGVPDNVVRHDGDMGVIYYYNNSVAYYTYLNSYLTLNGVDSIVGRAVHVHANADDCVNPIGNGGARWAQGVVGLTVPHDMALLQSLFTGVPTTQNGTAICAALTSSAASSASTATTATTATSAMGNMTASSSGVRASASSRATAGDSPASIISMAWAVLVVAFAFCF